MCPRTLVDRKRKRFHNAVDVVERLRDPTDPSTERTTPPSSAHIQLDDVPRTHDPAQLRGRVPSARRRDDGDDEAIETGLLLSTARYDRGRLWWRGAPHTTKRSKGSIVVSLGCPLPPYIKEQGGGGRPRRRARQEEESSS